LKKGNEPENVNDKEKTGDEKTGTDKGISDIADSLIEKAPNVSDHVILQEQEKQKQETENGKTDTAGTVFDANLHVADKEGNPVITSSGKFRNRSGRKPSNGADHKPPKVKSQLNIGAKEPGQIPEQIPQSNAGAIMAGKVAASTIFQFGQVIGGDEWLPITNAQYGIDERGTMEKAFADYFESQGINDFPPGIALTLTILAYAGPRFTMPKTKSRMEKISDWVKAKFFGKKPEPKKEAE